MASLISSVPVFEKGVANMGTIGANTYKTANIVFDTPFAEAPSIQLSLIQPTIGTMSNSSIWAGITAGAVNVTATGFTLVTQSVSAFSTDMLVDWVAIGTRSAN